MKIWFLTDWLVDCILGWSIDWFNDPLIELLTKFTLFKHISIIILLYMSILVSYFKRELLLSPEGQKDVNCYPIKQSCYRSGTRYFSACHPYVRTFSLLLVIFRVLTFSSWLSILPKITQAKTKKMTTTQQQMAYCLHPMPSIKRERGSRWLEKSWQVR